jgi:hypothetical protein
MRNIPLVEMRIKKSYLHQIWSEIRWAVLGSAWAAALLLGFLGFEKYALENGEAWSPVGSIYLTLQLIVLNSGGLSGRMNCMLDIARFLLPGLAAFTGLQAILNLFRDQTQMLRLWGLRDHAVICGLGRKGSRLAGELLDLGWRVVVIERDPGCPGIELLRRKGAIILLGDATIAETLLRARIQKAAKLICLLAEDSRNLLIAMQAYRLTQSRRQGRLTCVIHIASTGLLDLIRSSELVHTPGIPFELETFHPYERAARMLVLDCLQRLDEAPGHILVAGLGRLGQQVVLQAGYSWYVQHRPGRLCVTVLDREADSITTDLQQEYPQLPKVCELRPIQFELQVRKRLQHVLRNLGENSTIGAAFVCLGDPMLNFQLGLGLLQTPAVSGPLWIRVSSDVGLVDLLQNPLPGMGDPRRIRSFDIFEQTCSAGLVLGGLHEMLARGLYEIYSADSENETTRQTWEGLPETLKEANRQQANRIHHLLEAVGYRLLPLQDWDAGKRIFSKTEIKIMACLEHALWCQAKEKEGWNYGEQRDEKKRTHPDLAPWDDLPEREREKNLVMVRQLPVLLARIGFQIERAADRSEMLDL